MSFILLCGGFIACEAFPKEFVGNYYLNDNSFIILKDNTIQTNNTYIGKLIIDGIIYEAKASVPKTKFKKNELDDGNYVITFKKPIEVECYDLNGISLGGQVIALVFKLDIINKNIVLMEIEYTKND